MINYKTITRLFVAVLLFISTTVIAQNPVNLPGTYSSSVQLNYVRTWDATYPQQNVDTLKIKALREVKQTTAYFDGLGRPLQTVIKQGSMVTGSAPVDMIGPVVYDELGREKYKYLPFATTATDATKNNGLFKLDPFQQQAAFYNTQLTGQTGETSVGPNSLNWAYSQTNYEASALNRVDKAFAPGASWVGGSRGVEMKYWFNTIADSIKKWSVTNVTDNWGTYSMTGAYPAGELYKNVTVDEHGKQVVEFKDKEGKVILKKVQLTATADAGTGSNYTGWLCTYYIYDNLKNLRLVVQPGGVELLIANSWNITALSGDILKEQCFRYEYDISNRLIRKKIPGAGDEYMVYDARDRLIMTQDSLLRKDSIWLVTLYDALNLPVQTGKLKNTYSNNTFAQHITAASTSTTYPFTEATVPSTTWWEFLTKTGYDTYGTIPGASGLTSSLDNTYTSGTYMYTSYNTSPAYAQQVTACNQVAGLPTWTQVKVLGTASTYIYSVPVYDDRGRVIQVKTKNQFNDTAIITTQYNFSGQALVVVTRTGKTGVNAQKHIITTKMDYDDLGRLLTVKKTVSSSGAVTASKPELEIIKNEYDKLGQLKTKYIGKKKDASGNYIADPVDTLSFDYNIRSWLLGINRSQVLATNGQSSRYFGFELGYDKTANSSGRNFTAAQYNGNVNGMVWKSYGDGIRRKYDFTYDAANRLLQGLFEQNDAGSTWGITLMDYTVKMGDGSDVTTAYDANGNIKRMQQWGWKVAGPAKIDSLSYNYIPNSNRLQNVIDGVNDTQTKLGDFRSSTLYMTALSGTKTSGATDYVYDANGNLIKDRNKDIGDGSNNGITYNYLNLPEVITVRATGGTVKGTITYTYDAAGNKLQKVITEGAKNDTTLYLGGVVFQNSVLQFIGQEEGRLRYAKKYFFNGDSAMQYFYDYFLKDHLGNVRMVITEQKDTAKYIATMEAAYRAKEKLLFSNIPQTSYPKTSVPGGYPTDNTTVPNDSVAVVSGSGNKVGPTLVLKVMSGDVVDIGVKSFYRPNGSPGSNSSPLNDILNSLANGIVGIAGETKGSLSALNNTGTSPLLGVLSTFMGANNPNTLPTKPKAYLNWILLDDQLQYTGTCSGAIPVTGPDILYPLAQSGIPITKNGFLYIYVSNETQNWNVFFDNLYVQHYTGPVIEETHYYPFGLTMAGISSKAFGKLENRYKFNDGTELANKEFSDGSGVELYETDFRSYDPQIGRFHQMDPIADLAEDWSPYTFANNNPILFNDPLGLESDSTGKPKSKTLPVVTVTPPASRIQPAGVMPLVNPLSPLSPVPPPGTVIPFNPQPQIQPEPIRPVPNGEPSPFPFIAPGVLGTTGLTILFTIWPITPNQWDEGAYVRNPAFKPNPYPGHGNDRDNSDPHIVYVFTFTPKSGESPILKYGISDVYRYDMERPERQVELRLHGK
jgi:RHS repeat-associated protein